VLPHKYDKNAKDRETHIRNLQVQEQHGKVKTPDDFSFAIHLQQDSLLSKYRCYLQLLFTTLTMPPCFSKLLNRTVENISSYCSIPTLYGIAHSLPRV